MAQSVERILGKDEVPSSILGISTMFMFDGNSAVEPPVSMPNTEVKRCSADGSVAFAMRE